MMTPGTVCSTTHGSRDDGNSWSSSRLMLVDVVVFLLSRTGAPAVTSTWVLTPATPSLIVSGALVPAATGTFLFR